MGAFGLSVHILGGVKLPKAGGQGILGLGRTGPAVVLCGGAGGQELRCLSPPWRPPFLGLCVGASVPHTRQATAFRATPPGLLTHFLQGPCLA